ncbi:mucin-5AC-like [Amphibalanus amphitrite]|uniref:mucin-5AC-like n=1 Tax=Amphibalanus amphitrite TaxID=1232801 RepID=UPI001C91DB30|nr:mucin-5AC-like [Amphibalanus amphitrite]
MTQEMTRDVTDTTTEQHSSSTLTNAYSSRSANHLQQQEQQQQRQHSNAIAGVYYPFYNAECTYVERAKLPVPEEKTVQSSETKTTTKSSTSKSSTMKSNSDFFTTTWDDDQPFPVPVAFNMRDLSLEQFKTMNEFFSGSTISNPDYFDKKDTKHHESESKSWKEGNTEYHRSMTKTEITSVTTSKKTIVTDIPSGSTTSTQKSHVQDTRESNLASRDKKKDDSMDRQSRSSVRLRDTEGLRTRSQSLQKTASQEFTGRSHSLDGRIIPIQIATSSNERVAQGASAFQPAPRPAFDNQSRINQARESKYMKTTKTYGEQQQQPTSLWKPVVPQVPDVIAKTKDEKFMSSSTKTFEETKPEVKPLPIGKPVTDAKVTIKRESRDELSKNTITTVSKDKTESSNIEQQTGGAPASKPYKRLRSRSVEHIISPDEAPMIREQRRPRSARRSEPYVTPLVKPQAIPSMRPLRRTSPSPVRTGPKPFIPPVYSDVVDERAIKTSKTSEWTAKEILKPVVFRPAPTKPAEAMTTSTTTINSGSFTMTSKVDKEQDTAPAVCPQVTVVEKPHELAHAPCVDKPKEHDTMEERKIASLETTKSTTVITTKTEPEVTSAPRSIPIKPVWTEPVQTPKAAQTEQQKRMEQKFMKKVTERKESKELPIEPSPGPAPIYDVPRPPRPPSPKISEPSLIDDVHTSQYKTFTEDTVVTKERETVAPEPVPVQHEYIPLPADVDNRQQFYSKQICESSTVTTTTQQDVPSPPAQLSTALWHEPVIAAKAPQTEQQKRMEEKFMKKVADHQESKEMNVESVEVPDAVQAPVAKPQTETTNAQKEQLTQNVSRSTTYMTTKHETFSTPEPIPEAPVWHAPIQEPKVVQTEQQKRMEEKFIKKVIEHQESKDVQDQPSDAPAIPQYIPVMKPQEETTDEQRFISQVTSVSNTFTREEETTPAPASVPAPPVWHEPIQLPKAAQTEQQKRMEEKFIKKVAERKESKELPIAPKVEPESMASEMQTVDHTKQESERVTTDHQITSMTKVHQVQTSTVTAQHTDTREQPPAPIIPVRHEPARPQEVGQTETHFKETKESAHSLPTPIYDVPRMTEKAGQKPLENTKPKPFQAPVVDEQSGSLFETHMTQTVTTKTDQEIPTVRAAEFQPVWQEPVHTPKAGQSEQQKRMEEKFMKKVTEKKETLDQREEPVPVPIHEFPQQVEPPLSQPSEYHELKEHHSSHFEKSTTSTQEAETPVAEAVPTTPVWHEPEPQFQQTGKQKLMEEKFTKVIEMQETKDQEKKEAPVQAPVTVPIYDTPSPIRRPTSPVVKPTPYTAVDQWQPEPLTERQSFHSEEFHETKTTSSVRDTAPSMPHFVPQWQEPEQAPTISQSEQQKRMEEKFLKKVIENKESKVTPEETSAGPVTKPCATSADETDRMHSYKQELYTSNTSDIAQEAVKPVSIPTEPIKPIWQEPVQTPKASQSEHQRKMEERFVKKLTQNQESREISDKPEPVPSLDLQPEMTQMGPVICTKEVREFKTSTFTKIEQTTRPLSEPKEPIEVPRNEPVLLPTVPQTEESFVQEKLMKQESEVTKPETKVFNPVKPRPTPAEIVSSENLFSKQTEKKEFVETSEHRERQAAPAPIPSKQVWREPEQTPKAAQTEQQRRMEEKFIKKITERKELTDAPDTCQVSAPDSLRPIVPPASHRETVVDSFNKSHEEIAKHITEKTTVEIPDTTEQIHPPPPDKNNAHTPDFLKTSDGAKTKQPTTFSPKVQPIWIEPVETPKAAQTAQQKRMEEKFIKKVTERKEEKDVQDALNEQPIHLTEFPPLAETLPQPKATTESHVSQFQSWHETNRTFETIQPPSLQDHMPLPQPTHLPPRPVTTAAKGKKPASLRERERKTSYHDTSMSDFSDSETTIKIKEIESKPLQMDTYESYTNAFSIGPKIQEPPIYHKIHIEGQEEKKKENIYETVIPFPAPFKPISESQPAPSITEKTKASNVLESVLKHVTAPTATPAAAVDDTPQEFPPSEVHTKLPEKPEVIPAPEPVRFTPTQFVPAPPAPEEAAPQEMPTESKLQAVKHVDSPKPVRKQAPKVTSGVEYPFSNEADLPVSFTTTEKVVKTDTIVPKAPITVKAQPEISTKFGPKEEKQTIDTFTSQQKRRKKEEKLMKKYDDIAKRTKQTTREEEKRVFSPSPAPVERTVTPTSNITKVSESKQFSSRTESTHEIPKPVPPPTPTYSTKETKSNLEKFQQTKSSESAHPSAPIFRPPAEAKQQSELSQTFERTMTSQLSSSWRQSTPSAGPWPTAKPASAPTAPPHKRLAGSHATDESRKREVIAKISSQQSDQARPVTARPVSEPSAPWQESTTRTEKTESTRETTEQTVKTTDTVRPTPHVTWQPVPSSKTESSEKRDTAHLFSAKTDSGLYQRPGPKPTPRVMDVMPQQLPHTPTSMPEPYVDRQETFSSSKSDEKTATGHRKSESAEKRSHEVLHSVTNLPGSSTSKTMQQSSYQTMSQSFETFDHGFPAFQAPKALEFPPLLTPEPFSDHWSSLDQSMSWHDMTDLSSSLDEQINQQPSQPLQTIPTWQPSWKATDEKKTSEETSGNYHHSEQIIPIEMPATTSGLKTTQSAMNDASKQYRQQTELFQDHTPRSVPSSSTSSFKEMKSSSHFEQRKTDSSSKMENRERIVPLTPEPIYASPSQPVLRTPLKEEQKTSQGFGRFESTTQQTSKTSNETVIPITMTSQNRLERYQNIAAASAPSHKPDVPQQQQYQEKWYEEQRQQASQNQTPVSRPAYGQAPQQKTNSTIQQSTFEKQTMSSGHERKIPVAMAPAGAPRLVQSQGGAVHSDLASSGKTTGSPFGASPYVDKQETSSHSKSHEATGNVTKDTESSERSTYSVQRSGPKTLPGPTLGSSVTQSSSEVRHETSQSHTEHTSSCWPQSSAPQARSVLPPSSKETNQTVFETTSGTSGSLWGSQPAMSGKEPTNQFGLRKTKTETSGTDESKKDQLARLGSSSGSAGPRSESAFMEKRTKDGKNEHYQSLGYTSGGDVEHIEEANRSIRREKENMNAKKVDNKTEVFETEEVRPDGKYRIQKTVETKTEEELMRSKKIETTIETLPAIGR